MDLCGVAGRGYTSCRQVGVSRGSGHERLEPSLRSPKGGESPAGRLTIDLFATHLSPLILTTHHSPFFPPKNYNIRLKDQFILKIRQNNSQFIRFYTKTLHKLHFFKVTGCRISIYRVFTMQESAYFDKYNPINGVLGTRMYGADANVRLPIIAK